MLVVELVIGQVIEPMLYGHSTGLSPFSVMVAAIFWTWLWGPIGLILSTPLTLCLVVLGRHIERLEFLDVLLGDRPALTPVESFYQRMLAGDADEAQDQAELLLQRTLAVVLLRRGRAEGPATRRRRCRARRADRRSSSSASRAPSSGLVRRTRRARRRRPAPDQATRTAPAAPPHAERALPEAAGARRHGAAARRGCRRRGAPAAPVLCIAGRGPFDEAASAMLAQLLGKHGLGARVVPHEAVARTAIRHAGRLGRGDGVRLLSRDLTGSPSHLRYLVRRLRMRPADAASADRPVAVGGGSAARRPLRAAVGADHYTSSLREAVEACLDALHQADIAAVRPAEPADRSPAEDAEAARRLRSAQAGPRQRRRDLRTRARVPRKCRRPRTARRPAPIRQRRLAHTQARARRAHLELKVPAIGHLAQAERLQPIEADRAKGARSVWRTRRAARPPAPISRPARIWWAPMLPASRGPRVRVAGAKSASPASTGATSAARAFGRSAPSPSRNSAIRPRARAARAAPRPARP